MLPIGKNDHSATPAGNGAAEGGFMAGSRVVIDLPGDEHHGRAGQVLYVHSPRVVFVDLVGDSGSKPWWTYCVAGLRRA